MSTADERTVLEEVGAFVRAWNQADPRALAAFFTHDAVRVDQGTVRMLSADLAVWQGGFAILRPDAPPLKGYVVEILRKEAGRWLVLESHPKLFPAAPGVPGPSSSSHGEA